MRASIDCLTVGEHRQSDFAFAWAKDITIMAKGKIVPVVATATAIGVSQGRLHAQVFRPLREDHPCYQLVGQIAAETARIERLIDQSICNVAEIDLRVGAGITGQMIGPAPRFNALRQLAVNRGMSDAILKRINTTSGHASIHFDRRNRAVHDPWLEDTTGATHQDRSKPKSDPAFGPTPVSQQELSDMLGELSKYRSEVRNLVADIWAELNSS